MTSITGQTWPEAGLHGAVWVDPPRFEELQAAPFFGALGGELKDRLSAYHLIPKDSIPDLAQRAARLSGLAAWLSNSPCDKRLEAWIRTIEVLSAAKALHLQALDRIFQERRQEREYLHAYHHATDGWEDTRFRPIVLTERRYFWPEYGTYLGDYWMETLDPCHRHLPHMHAFWERLAAKGYPLPHYLLWLEENHTIAHKAWMRFLSPEEQKERRILIDSEGHLTNARGRPLDCTDSQHFFFVIDLAKTLFAARAEPHLCHSSFTRGGPVLASGALQARAGRLTHIKFESGHYLAGPAEWWQALQIFLEAGVHFGDGVRITVFDKFRYISRVLAPEAFLTTDALLRGLGI